MNRTQELLKWAVALAVLWAVVTGWSCGPVGQAAWADSGMQWAWMKGASTVNQSGVYGTPGTPAAANTPGARNNAVSWTDSAGALWLFGGLGYDGTGGELYYNDLWKCAPVTGNWVWVKGGQTSQSGVYGTLGTAAAENTPGGRTGAVSWTDSAGALWLFGGRGYDSAARLGRLNDLWKLDPATGDWTWMKGPNTVIHIKIALAGQRKIKS